jgi:hypothetical protein
MTVLSQVTRVLKEVQVKKKTRFSDTSKKMLTNLFQKMRSADQDWTNDIRVEKIDFTKGAFPRGKDFHYWPTAIKQEITHLSTQAYQFRFKIRGHHLFVCMVFPSSKTHAEINRFIKSAVHRIYLWYSMAFAYNPGHCAQTLNIYLYLTDMKKELPRTKDHAIQQINVNTGITTSCSPVVEIHLFREEEWFKVLIHESFHCLGLDFSEFDFKASNAAILSMFPVKSDVRVFETYCEMWAEILNIMMIVFLKRSKSTNFNNIDSLITKVEHMVDLENKWSLFQCAKVLDYYGLSYTELYESSDKAHLKRQLRYKEDTHVLSYYILKSIFMYFADDFVSWCADHNHGSINFNKGSGNHVSAYCDFIRQRHRDPGYLAIAEQLDGWFSEHTNVLNPILNTLRMTVYEM